MSNRVSIGSDSNEKPSTTIFNKVGSRKRVIIGVWRFRLPSSKASFSSSSSGVGGFSADRFLKRIGAKVARALSFMKRSSRSKVSSSTLPRSKSYAEPLDSHRAEAIEDCIEFLNSASCLKKSNSVS